MKRPQHQQRQTKSLTLIAPRALPRGRRVIAVRIEVATGVAEVATGIAAVDATAGAAAAGTVVVVAAAGTRKLFGKKDSDPE